MKITHADVDERFPPVAGPASPTNAARNHLRERYRLLGHELINLTPAGRNQALALTALEEVMLRADLAVEVAAYAGELAEGTTP